MRKIDTSDGPRRSWAACAARWQSDKALAQAASLSADVGCWPPVCAVACFQLPLCPQQSHLISTLAALLSCCSDKGFTCVNRGDGPWCCPTRA